jgi:Holliday junction resolvase RusA-like endonuclease
VTITVPLIPPSVNHYKVTRVRNGKRWTFVTPDAIKFKEAIAILSPKVEELVTKKTTYLIEITVFQGSRDKGDVDNYSKCVLDGLVDAGVIHSDAAITDLTLRKRRDRKNPRTEITVTAL